MDGESWQQYYVRPEDGVNAAVNLPSFDALNQPETAKDPKKRKRVPVACQRCRRRKIKCSGPTNTGPCTQCVTAAAVVTECMFIAVGSVSSISAATVNDQTSVLHQPSRNHIVDIAGSRNTFLTQDTLARLQPAAIRHVLYQTDHVTNHNNRERPTMYNALGLPVVPYTDDVTNHNNTERPTMYNALGFPVNPYEGYRAMLFLDGTYLNTTAQRHSHPSIDPGSTVWGSLADDNSGH